MRTIPGISKHLKRLDETITTKLIPAITGGIYPNETERKLFSLPPSQGGLGIPIFSEMAEREFANSSIITEQLQRNIIIQEVTNNVDKVKIVKAKSTFKQAKIVNSWK